MIEIQMRKPNELAPFISALPTNITMIEIGIFNGESTKQFMESGKVTKIYCIDPYLNDYDADDPASIANMNLAKENFLSVKAQYPDNIIFIEKTSDAAYDDITEQVDLVYIDGLHTFEGVKQDIIDYLPKLKAGTGILAGHDYGNVVHPGVRVAVDNFCGGPDMVFPDTSWLKRMVIQ